ncbi:hypothetical protein EE612_039449 [Oryza sativa]|nr:hypothetical protein EE612_039449 [Oryza sativa]
MPLDSAVARQRRSRRYSRRRRRLPHRPSIQQRTPSIAPPTIHFPPSLQRCPCCRLQLSTHYGLHRQGSRELQFHLAGTPCAAATTAGNRI